MGSNRLKLYQFLSNRFNLKQSDHNNTVYDTIIITIHRTLIWEPQTGPLEIDGEWMRMMESENLWRCSMQALNWTTAKSKISAKWKHKWNILSHQLYRGQKWGLWDPQTSHIRSGDHKMGTHDPWTSGFCCVYNHQKIGNHDTKKILGFGVCWGNPDIY